MNLNDKRLERAKAIRAITAQYPGYQKEATWADYDRRLTDIPTDELSQAVDELLSHWEGMTPPKPGHIRARWERIKQHEAYQQQQSDRFGTQPWAGGKAPDGSRWLTAGEARTALEQLRLDHPEAFDEPPTRTPAERRNSDLIRADLETQVHRIMRRAYELIIDRWGVESASRRQDISREVARNTASAAPGRDFSTEHDPDYQTDYDLSSESIL